MSGKEKENKEKIQVFSPGVLFVHDCGLNAKILFFSKLLLASDLNKIFGNIHKPLGHFSASLFMVECKGMASKQKLQEAEPVGKQSK